MLRQSACAAAQVWLTPLNAGGVNASLLHVLSALTSLTAVRLEAYSINDIKCCAHTPGPHMGRSWQSGRGYRAQTGAGTSLLAEWRMLCAHGGGGCVVCGRVAEAARRRLEGSGRLFRCATAGSQSQSKSEPLCRAAGRYCCLEHCGRKWHFHKPGAFRKRSGDGECPRGGNRPCRFTQGMWPMLLWERPRNEETGERRSVSDHYGLEQDLSMQQACYRPSGMARAQNAR